MQRLLTRPLSHTFIVATAAMNRLRKFTLFSVLLLFCIVNLFLYRHFSQPGPIILTQMNLVSRRFGSTDFSIAFINGSRSILSFRDASKFDTNVGNTRTAHTNTTGSGVSDDVLRFASSVSLVSHSQEVEGTFSTIWTTDGPSSVVSSESQKLIMDNHSLPLCPVVPKKLVGLVSVLLEVSSWEDIAEENPGLMPGGRHKPPDCLSRNRVAVVIPYRNREKHLKVLLKNLHPVLIRQELDYGIFVIDQAEPGKFNRAMLMNIGFAEAMKRYDYQCAVFHDVDLVPENDGNIYSCPEMPRHMSAAIDKFKYKLPYKKIYGGVSAVSKKQFVNINGFSNMYFGWGGEDDDMASRIAHAGYRITRYPMSIARYKMIRHFKDKGNERNPRRFGLLKNATKRMLTDGLNSLVYKVLATEELPTHLRIQVLINENDILKVKH